MKIKQIAILISIIGLLILFVYAKVSPLWTFLTEDIGVNPVTTLIAPVPVEETDSSTNFLLLGIPDDVSYGPNLTDSMTAVFYDKTTNHVTTIGIPRDIWRPTIKDKMNAAFAIGENNKPGTGKLLTRLEIEDLLGKEIHYVVIINFSNFESLIDVLGGVEVDVERSFTDKQYPIKGKENDECFGMENYECRYQTVSFKKGKQRMNGKTALIYARSRHSEGEEGSDFARSRRQQRLLSAIVDTMVEVFKSADIKRMKAMYQELDSLIQRDISNKEGATLARSIAFQGKPSMVQVQLPHELFTVPDLDLYDGRYVLVPKSSGIVHQYTDCLLQKRSEKACQPLKEE